MALPDQMNVAIGGDVALQRDGATGRLHRGVTRHRYITTHHIQVALNQNAVAKNGAVFDVVAAHDLERSVVDVDVFENQNASATQSVGCAGAAGVDRAQQSQIAPAVRDRAKVQNAVKAVAVALQSQIAAADQIAGQSNANVVVARGGANSGGRAQQF